MKSPILNNMGEFGLIDMIKRIIKVDNSVVKGIGDDAAVLRFTKDKYLLLTSDMLIEDVHFKRQMKPFNIGYKALACSISDIASMGGVSKYAVISLGLPQNLKVSFVKDLYRGLTNIANKYKINIVGGDTNRSKKIIVDVALLGDVEKRNLLLRSKAKVNDTIFVTGSLGGSFRTGRHLTFKPRFEESRFLAKHYHINSMIDISDGLAQDLSHILEESKKGAIIYEKAIPRNKGSSLKEALYQGEDFELIFTLSKKQSDRLIKDISLRKIKFPISQIGKITDKKNKLEIININGIRKILKVKGFKHF